MGLFMDQSGYQEKVKEWMEQVQKNRGVNAAEVLKYCAEIEKYATETEDVRLLGFACFYSGETYYLLNDGEKLFRYITRAITYLDESKQWRQVAEAYNIMAITSLNRGNAPIAMDYYLTGLNYCKKYDLKQQEIIINLNLGTLYMTNGQHKVAQKYFEEVKNAMKQQRELDDYASIMTCTCANLGRCYLYASRLEQAQDCIEQIDKYYWYTLHKTERIYVLCFKARYYNATGKITLCEECIEKVHANMDVDMAVMDIFDDLYDFEELLLDIGKDSEFWDIIHILEKMSKTAKIINLQRKIVSLKIKWYRKKHDNENYLKETGMYYELTEIMERENQYMIGNMLNVRSSLERANQRRLEAEAANERLLKKSETDPLTHLANRFRLNDYSAQTLERAMERGTTLAMEILDIDYFKEYNDNYGHQAGDACILAIAGELAKIQQEDIFCARYGGDEFIIIYEGMTEEAVYDKARKLRENIMALKIAHAYSKAAAVVTISQGICFDMPREENKSWDFLHVADAMLYQVKRRVRNNIVLGDLHSNVLKSGIEEPIQKSSI